MGRPKLQLSWNQATVLGTVLSIYAEVLDPSAILVVTGGSRDDVERIAAHHGVKCVFNPEFRDGSMLRSVQVGIAAVEEHVSAALIGLGDQPQLRSGTVRAVLDALMHSGAPLIVPSHANRRGHPWVIRRPLWPALMSMTPPATAREFLAQHSALIEYVRIPTPDVIQDLDTPEDYAASTSSSGS